MARKPTKTSDDRDRELMRGSPQDDPENQDVDEENLDDDLDQEEEEERRRAEQEELTEVELEGKKFSVPKAFADAYTGLSGKVGELDQELKTTQGVIKRLGLDRTGQRREEERRESQREPSTEDQVTAFFENPADFIRGAIKPVVDELTQGYQRDQGLQRFWDGFYRENQDLAESRELVDAVFAMNRDEILDLTPPEAAKRLADKSREFVLSLVEKHSGGKGGKQGSRATLEASSGTRRTAAGEEETPPQRGASVTSLGDVLRRRQRTRDNPSQQGAA